MNLGFVLKNNRMFKKNLKTTEESDRKHAWICFRSKEIIFYLQGVYSVTHRQTTVYVQTRATWKNLLLPKMSAEPQTKHTNKRCMVPKNSPNICWTQSVQARAGLNVRFGWIAGRRLLEWWLLSASCWSGNSWLWNPQDDVFDASREAV